MEKVGPVASCTVTETEELDDVLVPSEARTYTVRTPMLSQSKVRVDAHVLLLCDNSMVGEASQLSVAEAEISEVPNV